MKRVSHNHPSLRYTPCYDCGDDHNRQGYLDEIDNTYFCEQCGKQRQYNSSLAGRRQATLERVFPDYQERRRKANKRNLIASIVIVLATGFFASEPYIVGALAVFTVAMIPYMKPQ